jgi:hypothetical protein
VAPSFDHFSIRFDQHSRPLFWLRHEIVTVSS